MICVAQAEGEEIMSRSPLVDLVVGPQSYHRLPAMEAKVRAGGTSIDTDFPLDDKFEALKFGGGYDHCWVLPKGGGIQHAARLFDPSSGRIMDIHTDQPGIQFYAGNFMDGGIAGKGGVRYGKRSALCLETQNFPDAPNQPDFPSPVLRPGEVYKHVRIHRFSTAK